VLAINKSFLLKHVLNDDGEGMLDYWRVIISKRWWTIFLHCMWPNVHNLIASLKHYLGNHGYIDNALALKTKNHYDYMQGSYFPK
jgi:hypothetical protein